MQQFLFVSLKCLSECVADNITGVDLTPKYDFIGCEFRRSYKYRIYSCNFCLFAVHGMISPAIHFAYRGRKRKCHLYA